MVWHTKYWDAVDQLYWTPRHLGLTSIPKSQWGDDPTLIQLPRHRIQNGGTIYTRSGTYRSNAARMRLLEETLNHIFDITFAIAPDEAVSQLLHEPAGVVDRGPYDRVGREIAARLGLEDGNVTQQDGFFVSPASILGVELKLGSATRPDQVLKYLALALLEERQSGRRDSVALLFITPHDASGIFRQAGALSNGRLPTGFIDQFAHAKLNKTLRRLRSESKNELDDLAVRMRLAHTTWAELIERCNELVSSLDRQRAGDETLARLLAGFSEAVTEHGGTGCGEDR